MPVDRFRAVAAALLVALAAFASPVRASEGVLLVGYHADEDAWHVYRRTGDAPWERVPTEEEPRTPAYHGPSGALAYVDSSGGLRLVSDGAERVLLPARPAYTFTQPEFAADGRSIYVVGLIEGVSKDTDILRYSLDSGRLDTVVSQRSTQFEPKVAGGGLYYSSLACIPPACSRIIEELWRIDPITREARQLTLLNAMSREPAPHATSGDVWFVSDAGGAFHLWRHGADGSARQLTRGAVSDASPSVSLSGRVLFVRRTAGRHDRLLEWSADEGATMERPAPAGVVKLRDLLQWSAT